MKSSIKVDYASIYNNDLGEKQPTVRVDLFESDDPRDTLLHCIFKENAQLNLRKREHQNTFIIYEKTKSEYVCELASYCFQTLLALFPKYESMILCTASEEIYFEISVSDPPLRRSKGVDRYKLNGMAVNNIMRELVNDFNEFVERDNPSMVNVPDNSHGFRQLLDEKGIKWKPNEHYTLVDASVDLYTLGKQTGRAMEANTKPA